MTAVRSSSVPQMRSVWVGCWLLAGAAFLWHAIDKPARSDHLTPPTVDVTLVSAQADSLRDGEEDVRCGTKNIEDVGVGERVRVDISSVEREQALAELSEIPHWDKGEIDSKDWRKITFEMFKADGSRSSIVLLRPVAWLQSHGVRVGETIELVMPEQGLDGPADVLSIDPCPCIAPPPGQVVTGTFRHVRGNIVRLHLEGADEPLGVTDNHPIYSLDRQAFVHAAELQVGERLRDLERGRAILRIEWLPAKQPVYNLEIHSDHVFHVTEAGVLVHNTTPKWPRTVKEMNEFLSMEGRSVPDGPTTPGRGKVVWKPNSSTKITYEQHPYHPNAPAWHRGPHWHLDTPGAPHQRFLPGDPIPGF